MISERPIWVLVHYVGGHDQPCQGGRRRCNHCANGHNVVRWKGYLECRGREPGDYFLAELTEMSCMDCPDIGKAGGSLRGRRIEITRLGDRANGRVHVQLSAESETTLLPQPADLKSVLRRIWYGASGTGAATQTPKKES